MIPMDLMNKLRPAASTDSGSTSDQEKRAGEEVDVQSLLGRQGVKDTDTLDWTKSATFLKSGARGIDVEKTLADMFSIIRSMETKLSHVLQINALLERDINQAKERITELKLERDRLHERLAKKDEEIPTANELRMVIDQLLEERNDAELKIRDLKRQRDQDTEAFIQAQNRVEELESERKDFVTEINFVESRLSVALDAARQAEERLAFLEAQASSDNQKIKDLESDLQIILEEKFSTAKALRDTKQAMAELQGRMDWK